MQNKQRGGDEEFSEVERKEEVDAGLLCSGRLEEHEAGDETLSTGIDRRTLDRLGQHGKIGEIRNRGCNGLGMGDGGG